MSAMSNAAVSPAHSIHRPVRQGGRRYGPRNNGVERGTSLGESSILGSPGGNVEIMDGKFNATAGHQMNITNHITIKPEGQGSSHPKPSCPKGKNVRYYPREENSPSKNAGSSRSVGKNTKIFQTENLATGPPQRSCDIYYRHLTTKGRGSPLWIPAPNKSLPIEYQRTGMLLGDVGIIDPRGMFDLLFNICLPANHPLNRNKVPENFSQLSIDAEDIQEYSEFEGESYLSSASIKKIRSATNSRGLIFESSASEGAILTMPVGSNSRDLRNYLAFEKYVAQHVPAWYRYAKIVRGRKVRNGDIRLVTGNDKTSNWGMATFSSSGSEQDDPLYLSFLPGSQNASGRTYEWEYSGMAEVRKGPDSREMERLRGDISLEETVYENQCLFVRTLNAKLSEKIWGDLLAEVGEIETDEGSQDHSVYYHGSPTSSSTSSNSAIGDLQSSSSASGSYTTNCNALSHVQPDTPGNLCSASVLISSPHAAGALTCHPSDVLNDMLLDLCPDSRIAITKDSDWAALLKQDDVVLPSNEELCTRALSTYQVHEEDGILSLRPQDMKELISFSSVHSSIDSVTDQLTTNPLPELPLVIALKISLTKSVNVRYKRELDTWKRISSLRIFQNCLVAFSDRKRTTVNSQLERFINVCEEHTSVQIAQFCEVFACRWSTFFYLDNIGGYHETSSFERSRYLQKATALNRETNDRVLNVVFSLSSTSADIQLESDLFLRDMRKILSVLVTVLKHGSVLPFAFVLANSRSERSFKPITLQIGNTVVDIESLLLLYSFSSLIWPSKERDLVSMLSLLGGSSCNVDASNGEKLSVEQRSFNSASLLLALYDLATVLKSVDMNSSSTPNMIYTHMSCDSKNNIITAYRPATDICFPLHLKYAVNFFLSHSMDMTKSVPEVLAKNLLYILPDHKNYSSLTSVDLGARADLSSLFEFHSKYLTVSSSPTDRHNSLTTPALHWNSSVVRTLATSTLSLFRAKSLEAALWKEELPTDIDQGDQGAEDMENEDMNLYSYKRKRGARKNKYTAGPASAAELSSTTEQDNMLETLAKASQDLAREISKASKSSEPKRPLVKPESMAVLLSSSSSSSASITSNRTRSGWRSLSSKASGIITPYSRSLMNTSSSDVSTRTSSSGFTRFDNSSSTSVSTTATSMSSASWESNEKPTVGHGFGASSTETTAANRTRYPIPRNVKIMQGIPWEIDQLPRKQDTKPISDIFGSPPVHRQRGRKTTRMQNMMITRPSAVDEDLNLNMGLSDLPNDDLSSSSNGSIDGLAWLGSRRNVRGSISNNAVPPDEGFTDYLADESEVELQGQVETRAAVIALNRAEELEFKMARQQLAQANLRPPKSWNPSKLST